MLPAHGVPEEIEHADADGAAERHVRIGERGRKHVVLAAHPAKQQWSAEQERTSEDRAKPQRQQDRMKDERIRAVALPATERARYCGRHTVPHAAVGRLQDEHDERKCQRRTGEHIGAEATQKKAVERDHAHKGKEVEDVGCRQPQQRRQDRSFQHQLGARRAPRLGRCWGRWNDHR
jgi:hypothetical protein